MARLISSLVILLLSGCSVMDNQRCRALQAQGLVQGTLGSCTACVGQLGPSNADAINGCALGMDAANLIGGRDK